MLISSAFQLVLQFLSVDNAHVYVIYNINIIYYLLIYGCIQSTVFPRLYSQRYKIAQTFAVYL